MLKHATAAFFCIALGAIPFISSAHSLEQVASNQTFEDRLRNAELAGDREKVTAICREWYLSGQYSPGLLNWNYNALMSVEDNGILITYNESDTYPAFLLQFALGIRPDVVVLNTQLLENQHYRDWITHLRQLENIPAGSSPDAFFDGLLNAGLSSPKAVAAYFGVMSNKAVLRADQENMYLTGLALKYSPRPFDNVAVLRFNFENRFRTDYLELALGPEPQAETVARINLNYIPAFSLLHRYYMSIGDITKAKRIETLAVHIGSAGGREAEVRALFGSPLSPGTTRESVISPKMLDKSMKKVTNRLYAGETEVTNGQFELFLQDLLKNKEYEQLDLCRPGKTEWRTLLPDTFSHLSDAVLFVHGHPDAVEMPVQNISHEAARQYCAWITQVYNASPVKKRFKKVLFRLPEAGEWTLAASGGLPNQPYPWNGGYYVRNSKGCYLCNIKATQPCGDCPDDKRGGANDGGFFTVPATAYFPNDYGLYNVSGNVSEMLASPGKTMGGSWRDDAYWCQIRNVREESGPSPAIGFRVFMEVIEE